MNVNYHHSLLLLCFIIVALITALVAVELSVADSGSHKIYLDNDAGILYVDAPEYVFSGEQFTLDVSIEYYLPLQEASLKLKNTRRGTFLDSAYFDYRQEYNTIYLSSSWNEQGISAATEYEIYLDNQYGRSKLHAFSVFLNENSPGSNTQTTGSNSFSDTVPEYIFNVTTFTYPKNKGLVTLFAFSDAIIDSDGDVLDYFIDTTRTNHDVADCYTTDERLKCHIGAVGITTFLFGAYDEDGNEILKELTILVQNKSSTSQNQKPVFSDFPNRGPFRVNTEKVFVVDLANYATDPEDKPLSFYLEPPGQYGATGQGLADCLLVSDTKVYCYFNGVGETYYRAKAVDVLGAYTYTQIPLYIAPDDENTTESNETTNTSYWNETTTDDSYNNNTTNTSTTTDTADNTTNTTIEDTDDYSNESYSDVEETTNRNTDDSTSNAEKDQDDVPSTENNTTHNKSVASFTIETKEDIRNRLTSVSEKYSALSGTARKNLISREVSDNEIRETIQVDNKIIQRKTRNIIEERKIDEKEDETIEQLIEKRVDEILTARIDEAVGVIAAERDSKNVDTKGTTEDKDEIFAPTKPVVKKAKKTIAERKERARNVVAVQKTLIVESEEDEVITGSQEPAPQAKRSTVVLTITPNDAKDELIEIVEVIPKEIALSASELSFNIQPIILEDDPIVMWQLQDIEETVELTYSIDKEVEVTGNTIALAEEVEKEVIENEPSFWETIRPLLFIPLAIIAVIYIGKRRSPERLKKF